MRIVILDVSAVIYLLLLKSNLLNLVRGIYLDIGRIFTRCKIFNHEML